MNVASSQHICWLFCAHAIMSAIMPPPGTPGNPPPPPPPGNTSPPGNPPPPPPPGNTSPPGNPPPPGNCAPPTFVSPMSSLPRFLLTLAASTRERQRTNRERTAIAGVQSFTD